MWPLIWLRVGLQLTFNLGEEGFNGWNITLIHRVDLGIGSGRNKNGSNLMDV